MNFTAVSNEIKMPQRMRRSSQISVRLREMIASGQLKPGDRLPTEEELCRYFGVSRTTLREAIQMLRVSGLLKVTPGRGSFVQIPDFETVADDLALYSRYSNVGMAENSEIHLMLLQNTFKNIAKTSKEDKQRLNKYILSPHNSEKENELIERNWHLEIAFLGGNTTTKTLLHLLLSMDHSRRLERFSDPDEVMRTIQTQMRFNAAVLEKDISAAQRVLACYLGHPTMMFPDLQVA